MTMNVWNGFSRFDEDKNFSLTQFQQGNSLDSHIVLLESELVEIQEIMRNNFSKAIQTIAGKNRIFVYPNNSVTHLDVTVSPNSGFWDNSAGTPIATSSSPFTSNDFTISISNLFLWTELGYIKQINPISTIIQPPLTVGNSATTYLAFEIWEEQVTGNDDDSIVDSRVQSQTAYRRKLNIELRSQDGSYPTIRDNSVVPYTNRKNQKIIKIGKFSRAYTNIPTPSEKWFFNTVAGDGFDFVNAFAKGNEVGITDLSPTSPVTVPANALTGIQFAKLINIPSTNDYKAITTRYFNKTTNTELAGEVDIMKIPSANFDFIPGAGANPKNVLELKFPTTLVFKETYTNTQNVGVETVKVPYGGFRPDLLDNSIVEFDPIINEKASRYDALLAQGTNFLFSKYSGLFFYPSDDDVSNGGSLDLIDRTNSSSSIYVSNSNGFANLTFANNNFQTKNLIKDTTADLTSIMVLYDAELSNANLQFQYQTNLSGTWNNITPNTILDNLPNGITSIKIKVILSGVSGSTALLKSIALFHSPISSPNILRSNTANWEENVVVGVDNKTFNLTNRYTPNLSIPQIEVFLKEVGDNQYRKLVRASSSVPGSTTAVGYYLETSPTQIVLASTASANARLLVRPIASAIDTNDINGQNIASLSTKIDDLDSRISRYFLNGEDVGLFKKLNLNSPSNNIDITTSGADGDMLTYNFAYNNTVNRYVPSGDVFGQAVSGTASNFKTLSFYMPWGSNGNNAQVGVGDGFTWDITSNGNNAFIKFRNTYYRKRLASSSITNLGIPRNIIFGSGLTANTVDTSGNIELVSYIGNGLYFNTSDSGSNPKTEVFLEPATGLGFRDVLDTMYNGSTAVGGELFVKYTNNNLFKLDIATNKFYCDAKAKLTQATILAGNNAVALTSGNLDAQANNIRVSKWIAELPNTSSNYNIIGLTHSYGASDNVGLLRIIPSAYIKNNSNANLDDNWVVTFHEDPTNDSAQTTLTCNVKKVAGMTDNQKNIITTAHPNSAIQFLATPSYENVPTGFPNGASEINRNFTKSYDSFVSVSDASVEVSNMLNDILDALNARSHNFVSGDAVVINILSIEVI